MTEKDRAQQQTEPGQQPKPATHSADAELSDEQLDQVAGGCATGKHISEAKLTYRTYAVRL